MCRAGVPHSRIGLKNVASLAQQYPWLKEFHFECMLERNAYSEHSPGIDRPIHGRKSQTS